MSTILPMPPRRRVLRRPVRRLVDRAQSDLAYIRSSIESSGKFTAVPGRACMLMGAVALVAALAAGSLADGFAGGLAGGTTWIAIWITAAVVATGIGVAGMLHKARALGTSVLSVPGRKFLLGLCPPLVAGAILSVVLIQAGAVDALPGMWLLLYGAAATTGGASSVPTVPVMGACFMALGCVALATPAAWGEPFMALGFGGLHLVFGRVIARRHGG